jgi:hypothetical protein
VLDYSGNKYFESIKETKAMYFETKFPSLSFRGFPMKARHFNKFTCPDAASSARGRTIFP